MSKILDSFYKVNNIVVTDNIARANITINKDHIIFKSHFPGNPITPGVCMIQIIKEITEKIVKKKLFMKSVDNIKFIAIINPFNTPELEFQLDISETDEGYKVKNISKFDNTMALKSTTNYIVK